MAYEFSISELKDIIRRRKRIFLISSSSIMFAFLIAALALPSIYESQAMIIIENQEIPKEYVQSTTTTFISQRLEILERRILSYGKLLEIVKSNNPYPDMDSKGEMVSQLKNDITFKTINVSMADRRRSATIAFTLAFQHNNPKTAQQICDVLSNLFVNEDLKSRQKQAKSTTKFLEKELEELREQVRSYEERISKFKAANINQLPGSMNIFQQTIFRLEQDIDSLETKIRTLTEKKVYLKSQIANIDPLIPILTDSGQVASNPNNRLKYLRLQLIQKQAKFSEKHPDIIRLKSEISELEAQGGSQETYKEKMDRLKIIEKKIAEMKTALGEKHPDLIKLVKESELLKQQVSDEKRLNENTHTIDEKSDNPQYMNIKAQIIVAESEITALLKEKSKLTDKLEDYQRKLEMAPFIDEEYNSLTMDYKNAKKKYDEVSNKLHNAKIAKELDTSESGERFHIEFPAYLPYKPIKPNRLMIIVLGFVLGIGCSVLLVAIAEGLDSSVKESNDIEAIAGVPVLATVSFFDSPLQKKIRTRRYLLIFTAIVTFLVIISFAVNWFIVPFDQLYENIADRLVEIID